ncbi:MAG: alpha/beta hydrolase [Pseudomonadota bacterium]
MSGHENFHLELDIQGTAVSVSGIRRKGDRPALLSLHGFGSTKEDYADVCMHPAFAGRDLIAYDAPGFGASTLTDPSRLSMGFLVELARAVIDRLEIEKCHLSGHSMGGLSGLLFAHHNPDRILSFMSIEGNVAPEDCFLSRQIIEYPANSAQEFMDNFRARVAQRSEYGSALYAQTLPWKVEATSAEPIFTSMVGVSDSEPLLDYIGALPVPRAFIYGEQNTTLSYLPSLPDRGVEAIEIPQSAHFPMYSNPPALWAAMAAFIDKADQNV